MGRPSEYDRIDMEQVRKLAEAGWIDRDMADFFGVSESTWTNWKKAHPEFLASLKDWKAQADARVERALYERATGYSHPDTHIAVKNGKVIKTEITKTYAPDTTAAIFWLKNRNPAEWRDKIDVDATYRNKTDEQRAADEAIDAVLDKLSPEALKELDHALSGGPSEAESGEAEGTAE